MSNIKGDLIKARAKIEKGWCQYNHALDAQGRPTRATSPGAVQFCALGALAAVRSPRFQTLLSMLCSVLNGQYHQWTVSTYNDHPSRTQEEVLALFDKAIALAEEE